MIQFACTCGRTYEVEPERAGRKVVCLSCGAELQIPELATSTSAPSSGRLAEAPIERTNAPRAEIAPFASRFSGPAGENGAAFAESSAKNAPSRPAPSDRGGLTGIVAVVLGVGASAAIGLVSPAGSALSRMFSPKHVESVIPTAIVALFLWGVARCFVRRRRVAELARGFDLEELKGIASSLRREGLPSTLARVGVAPDPGSMRGRIRAILEQWSVSPGLQNADVVAQQRATQDDEDLESAYGTGKLVVWALPVLGLIGTVIGISLAVGGFAQFLGGGIDDVAVIKKNLVSVTGGLSFAFLITLIGLATSLVLMFMVSSLSRRESRLLGRMQQSIAESLLPALQEVAPAETHARSARYPADESLMRAWQQSAGEAARAAMSAVQSTSTQILQSIGDHLRTQADQAKKSWEDAARRLEALGQAEREHVTEAARTAVTSMQGMMRELHDRLADLRVRESQELGATTAALGRLTEATQQASLAQATLLRAMESLSASGVAGQIAAVSSSFARAIEETRVIGASYDTLARNTQALSALHQSLQASTRELVDQRLSATLVGVRDSLAAIVQILEAFRQPFVLKAVPATTSERSYPAPAPERSFPIPPAERPYTLQPPERPYVAPASESPFAAPPPGGPFSAPPHERPYST